MGPQGRRTAAQHDRRSYMTEEVNDSEETAWAHIDFLSLFYFENVAVFYLKNVFLDIRRADGYNNNL